MSVSKALDAVINELEKGPRQVSLMPAATRAKHYAHNDYGEDGDETNETPKPKAAGTPAPKTQASSPSAMRQQAQKSTNQENDMSKDIQDLFKSELGAADADQTPITKCVHCNHDLTKSDLIKGAGSSFVVDDNDQPSSGGSGQVEASRPGAGVGAQEMAPLLKGEEAGDDEQFIITKGEMAKLGFDVSELDGTADAQFVITKGELVRKAGAACLPEMRKRKGKVQPISKSDKPVVKPFAGIQGQPMETTLAKGTPVNPTGNPLVQWINTGDDERIAKSIERGELGVAADESVRTNGNGLG